MAEHYLTAPQVVDLIGTQSDLDCQLETNISRLGEIVDVPVYVPHYATCHTSVVATGKQGKAIGELYGTRSVAIHENTHQIFVVNSYNHRVEIFSETGEFLYQLGVGQLSNPWGIAIRGDNVYVSSWDDHTVSKFSLTEMCRVRRIGGKGSNNGQFNGPLQLATDSIGRVFIADLGNDRICIHDPDLNHLLNITHPSMIGPEDVEVSRDRLYVLSPSYNPCMLVLTLEGDKLNSLITCGRGMDVLDPYNFCLDSLNNFVICDPEPYLVCVFSQEGNILHKIERKVHQPGILCDLQGIAITPNGRLVCVTENEEYGLQIFY